MELFCDNISQFLETRDEKELDSLLSATTKSKRWQLLCPVTQASSLVPSLSRLAKVNCDRQHLLAPTFHHYQKLYSSSRFPKHSRSTCATSTGSTSHSLPFSSSHCHFAPPKTAADVARARQTGIPPKTQQDTRYCVKIWEEWGVHRTHITGVNIGPLNQLSLSDLAPLEVRKKKE